ncbi:MAG: hypothetical protein QOD46_686 [Actinomycetota bacterium]|jgi:Domain of unknown function (DUF4331)|nr:hypothetical protein [Actinomycetota bacterium]
MQNHRTPRRTGSRRKTIVGAISSLLVLLLGAALLGPIAANASSHREAPLTAADPQIDGTDLYAFRSPDHQRKITIISNWIPFEEPAGGPNFFSFATGVNYDVKIDNNGDARADVTYRWVFANHYRHANTFLYNTGPVTTLKDQSLNFYQTYKLYEIRRGHAPQVMRRGIVAPSDVGAASMPDYAKLTRQAVDKFDGGTSKTFAGQADDPFFLDLRVFDLIYGGNFSEVGTDTLNGFNVNVLALQVPRSDLAKHHNTNKHRIIGVWTTASRRTTRVQSPATGAITSHGRMVQVSRLGNPLVNEVVVPTPLKDYFNASKPKNDAQFLPAVQDPKLPHIVHRIYGLPVPDSDPNTPGIQRADLIKVFLKGLKGLNKPKGVTPSEELRLNMKTPVCEPGSCSTYSNLGVIGGDVAGYPNGRRLADDVIDIALQVVEGELIGNPNNLGDNVNANDKAFRGHFPYVALPWPGSDAAPHSNP